MVDRVLAGDPWRGLMEMRHADGSTHRVELTCSPLREDGEVRGLAVLLEDVGGQEETALEAGRLRERLTRLARVTSELATAQSIDAVRKIVVSHSADAVGATMAALSLRDPKDPATAPAHRARPTATTRRRERYASLPARPTANPAAEAVRTGERIVCRGGAGARRPLPRPHRPRRAVGHLPAAARRRAAPSAPSGCSFPGIRVLDAAEIEFFEILADSCAQAIERIEAQEVADWQSAKLTFLAEAAIELSSSLDYEATLAKVAQLVVPEFADWSTIDLVDDGVLRRLAVAHIDPAKVQARPGAGREVPARPRRPQRRLERHAHRGERVRPRGHRRAARDAGPRRTSRSSSSATSSSAAPSPSPSSPGAGCSAS